ncbi:MAG: hypothetical protein H3C28_02595 [Sphingomonadales bacterium]|nr:hypothetical protein [Sphingomonadales bacterium]
MKSELVHQLTETFEGHALIEPSVEHWLVRDLFVDVNKMVDLGFGQKSREKNNIYQEIDIKRRLQAPKGRCMSCNYFHCSLGHNVLYRAYIRPLRVRPLIYPERVPKSWGFFVDRFPIERERP